MEPSCLLNIHKTIQTTRIVSGSSDSLKKNELCWNSWHSIWNMLIVAGKWYITYTLQSFKVLNHTAPYSNTYLRKYFLLDGTTWMLEMDQMPHPLGLESDDAEAIYQAQLSLKETNYIFISIVTILFQEVDLKLKCQQVRARSDQAI